MTGSLARAAAGLLMAALLSVSQLAAAGDLNAEMAELVAAWDAARFTAPRWERPAALREVATRAAALSDRFPEAAGPLAVRGGALTVLAIGMGGARGAEYASEARTLLKAALTRDPAILDGAAHAYLGLLYHRMPAAPLGVGSPRRAERQFRDALAVNPDGAEANYLYAEFLADDDRAEEAIRYAEVAMAAGTPSTRRLADTAMSGAARDLLTELRPGGG